MKIIIINGSASVGKDEFVKVFKKNYKYKCINWSTIDEVKKISKKNFGWNGEKTDEARKFLSEIKRVWTEFNNGPFNDMIQKINKNNIENTIHFVHCREPHEIQKFVDFYGDSCITLLIKKDYCDIPDNPSDRNVEDFKYQHTISNNGSKKELEQKCLLFMNSIIK
jgi:hypothetical protein